MSSNDVAIRVTNLSKCYQIYDNPRDRLKQFVTPRFQRLVGQEPKKYFREFFALKDISFEIKKGETVGIIGCNGSGKSTLLQIICGTLSPSSGVIDINGRVAALLELGSGFNPEFTGRENVYMNAAILGLNEQQVDERFDDIVAFSGIGQFIEQEVKTYSSGMYVRLAFSVIAHVDADILVIDEALAVGDAFFTQKCMRFLREFMKTGTVLFVSHDTAAVVNLCNKAIWIDSGESKFQGIPKEATERYLAGIYESHLGGEEGSIDVIDKPELPLEQPRDMRLDIINASQYRNDLELFSFKEDGSQFGKGGAKIVLVQLQNEDGRPLSWVVGGENVQLTVFCDVYTEMNSPIIGFYFKDRLGQMLFGDNTFNFTQSEPLHVSCNQRFSAIFEFRMPILPEGNYSVTVAIADGTQYEHVQHHWIHDALLVKSHSSSVTTGLVGVPMKSIRMFTL